MTIKHFLFFNATKAQKRNRMYWICQFTGWSFYTIAVILIFAAFQNYSWTQFAVQLQICGIGFALTHFFRLFIKRYGWLNFPLQSLVARIIIACVFLALLWEMLALVLLIFVFGVFTLAETQLGIFLGTVFSWSATLLIWSLTYFGFHYIENYKKTEVEKWRLEALVKETQLRALKFQMNPHFIFNCLNNIRGLIVEDTERAQTVVTQLANILRYSLKSQDAEMVPLEEELRIVFDYLALETVRLEERLKVNFQIDPVSLDVLVPTMLIQTLIENGIKYGIATRPDGGEITLTSCCNNSKLQIQVKNTGQLSDSVNSTGMGLNNVIERLNLLFGDSAWLKLENTPPDYVTAHIEIPVQRYK